MKRHGVLALILFALAFPALAQEAPPPHKSPRTPVHRETVVEHKAATPPSREVQGQLTVIDAERLRLGDMDLRLFGIVPPQLSASFGPQARSALDELTAAQNVICTIRDRDREERFLATCHNASNADLALELLRRGLAVAARGSVATTDLAASYIGAEQVAQAQKAGVWSVVISTPTVIADMTKTVPAPNEMAKSVDITKDEKTTASLKSEQNSSKTLSETPVKTAANVMATSEPALTVSSREPGFLARYQLFVTGIVMLLTALGIFIAIGFQRHREKRAEVQAVAAALRGELTAARSICLGRLRATMEHDDKDISWPRIRSTLYQAYVGRIGFLGAELARRIASIYGQASDYAAYYDGSDASRVAMMPKKHALQALMQHIDDVLPRLTSVEVNGLPSQVTAQSVKSTALVPMQTSMSLPAGSSSSDALVTTNGAEPASISSVTSPAQFWTVVRKLVRAPWGEKRSTAANDPIAEYTALIEEEMKRFSFTEGESEAEAPPVETPTTWPPHKAQGSF